MMSREARQRARSLEAVRRWRRSAVVRSWQLRLPVAHTAAGWALRAACRGLPSDMMLPETAAGVRVAQAVCEGCPVRLSCLGAAWAEEHDGHAADVFGVRGGLSPTDRREVYVGRVTP